MGTERGLDMKDKLSEIDLQHLKEAGSNVRKQIIEMTTLANSGHPGGPLGFVEMFLTCLLESNIDPKNPFALQKDKFIFSAGHYSALVYSALANSGFFPEEELAFFRKAGSRCEGHVSHKVPGVWLDTGILGQGLSAATGVSVADRLLGHEGSRITVFMGDGEQDKGQIAEALRFAKKFRLNNITAVIDANAQQLSGPTESIMPIGIEAIYKASGWNVIEVDGYDMQECWDALKQAKNGLTAIIARTTMGKGYPKIEGNHKYHGSPLSMEQAIEALTGLGFAQRFEELKQLREKESPKEYIGRPRFEPKIIPGEPILYEKDADCRSAWGNALMSIARANLQEDGKPKQEHSPIVVIDCDLASSVKTEEFGKSYPNNFFQAGIQEHHAATMAGALSIMPVLAFLADFGALSVTEMYSQHRLTAINDGNLKLVSTHCGYDVGEDGKTHQAIDYLALSNHPGWQTFVPADANQTDRAVRYMATHYGCMHIAMGRSKMPVITKQNNTEPFFDTDYKFEPGKIDLIRDFGNDVVIFTHGSMTHRALKVAEELSKIGIGVKVLNLATPTAPDKEGIISVITDKTRLIVTYEDHFVGEENCKENLGMAGTVRSILYDCKHHPEIYCAGVRAYGLSGKPDDLYRTAGLHEDQLFDIISKKLRREQ